MDITLQDFVQIFSTVGFPAFVAAWLLWYGNKRQKEMIEAINELKFEIAMNRKVIEHFLLVKEHEGRKTSER